MLLREGLKGVFPRCWGCLGEWGWPYDGGSSRSCANSQEPLLPTLHQVLMPAGRVPPLFHPVPALDALGALRALVSMKIFTTNFLAKLFPAEMILGLANIVALKLVNSISAALRCALPGGCCTKDTLTA